MGPLAEDSHGRQYDDGAHSLAYSTGSQDEETMLLPNQTHDMSMQGSRPDGSLNGTTPMPPNINGGSNGGNRDMESYKIERNRSRNRGHRTPSGTQRVCKKCELPLTGQFVRALDGTFHLDCFRCAVGKTCSFPLARFLRFKYQRSVALSVPRSCMLIC